MLFLQADAPEIFVLDATAAPLNESVPTNEKEDKRGEPSIHGYRLLLSRTLSD